jgi:hypothetical protein
MAMKWNRDKALLETLRFADKTGLDRLGKSERIKVWKRIKRHLFWDSPVALGLEDLDSLQRTLRDFFNSYFMEILNIWQESPWKGSPGNEVDRLAHELLSQGKLKTIKGALKRVAKTHPRLWEIYNIGEWIKELPQSGPRKRSVYCDGDTLRIFEEPLIANKQAIEQVIKLFAMDPPIPLSRLFICAECGDWSINTRKTRKHWVCSKWCYDKRYVRENRDPETHAKNARRSYWRKQGHSEKKLEALERAFHKKREVKMTSRNSAH